MGVQRMRRIGGREWKKSELGEGRWTGRRREERLSGELVSCSGG